MKVLIWIGCLILNCIMQIISKVIVSCVSITDDSSIIIYGTLNGILAGASLGFCIWLAIKLCNTLDWYRVMKKAAEAGMTISEYGRYGLSEEFLKKVEELCNTYPIEQVKTELKSCVKKGKITKEQYIILLKEYSTTK